MLVTVLFRIRTTVLTVALLGLSGQAAIALSCARTYDAPPMDVSSAHNIGALKLQALRYACSGELDRDLARVASRARAYIERRAPRVTKAAIVIDVDETALSNWPEIEANDIGYIPEGPCDSLPKGPCGWNAWVASARAEAIKPTLELFNAAKTQGVSVFFVTGRTEAQRDATVRNLNVAGYDGWIGLMMRGEADRGIPAGAFKRLQREKIATQGYTIIANVGDQKSDLAGEYSGRTFLLPNPFYYLK